MERAEIKAALAQILEDETGEPVKTLDDTTQIVETYGLDSADMVSLIMHVEGKFHIRMNQEELATATSVGRLLDLVEAKIRELPAKQAA